MIVWPFVKLLSLCSIVGSVFGNCLSVGKSSSEYGQYLTEQMDAVSGDALQVVSSFHMFMFATGIPDLICIAPGYV